jgi:hypothetical protein
MAISDLFRFSWSDGYPSAQTNLTCQDATYVWFVTSAMDGTHKLYRLRKSDRNLIKPDGSVGTGANAYYNLANNQTQNVGALFSDGTTVYVHRTWDGMSRHSAATMAYLGDVAAVSGTRFASIHGASNFDGQYFWICSDAVNPALWRVDASGNWTSMMSLAGLGGMCATVDGLGYVYLSVNFSNTRQVRKYRCSDMNLMWTHVYSTSGGNNPYNFVIDVDSGCMYYSVGGGSYGSWRVRLSDGALLDATYGVLSQPANTNVGLSISATASLYLDGYVYWWNAAGAVYRSLSGNNPASNTMQIGGNNVQALWGASSTGSVVRPLYDPVTATYFCGMSGNWTTAGVAWMKFDTPPIVPKLTTVTPNVTGLNLTFDNPVDVAASPGIGSPKHGLVVDSAAKTDSLNTQINMHPADSSVGVGY